MATWSQIVSLCIQAKAAHILRYLSFRASHYEEGPETRWPRDGMDSKSPVFFADVKEQLFPSFYRPARRKRFCPRFGHFGVMLCPRGHCEFMHAFVACQPVSQQCGQVAVMLCLRRRIFSFSLSLYIYVQTPDRPPLAAS